MLRQGDLVPHFEVTSLDGERFSYSTVWQRSSLVLVAVPARDSTALDEYVSGLTALMPEFRGCQAECVITRDVVPWLSSPGVVVADKWGEIVHIASTQHIADLPGSHDLLEWIEHVQMRCPECEGEAK